ncbi:ABC transporter permease [Rhodospirillum sp. A1_3_36]|uniref:ABC transporter permease n=1 Tax=Rhodospirillum sp. A1_3_36 TaxID=3391666 RepID=UPI0039A5ED9E
MAANRSPSRGPAGSGNTPGRFPLGWRPFGRSGWQPFGRSGGALDGQRILLAVIAVYVVGLCALPLLRLFTEGTGGDLWTALSDPATLAATRRTVVAGLGATALSVVLGGSMALLVALTNPRLKTLLVFLLLLPMLIPAQISALAWLELTGPSSTILGPLGLAPPPGTRNWLYSREGIILLMGIEHSTMVFLAVRAGLRALPGDLVEAARAAGAGPFTILWHIILPLLRPSLVAGAALAFVAAIGNFGIPALLGIPGRYTLLTALVYQRLSGFGPSVLGEVAALSLILAALAGVGLLLQAIAKGKGRVAIASDGTTIAPYELGRWRLAVEALVWVVLMVISVIPLFALIGASLIPALGVPLTFSNASLTNYATALGTGAVRRSFLNSAWLAGAAALVTPLVAVPLAYAVVIRQSRVARILDTLADIPFALPGIVVSIACILTFLPPLPGLGVSLYGTAWIILFAYLARFLALGLRPAVAGMANIDPALEEAGRIAGVGPLRRLTRIILPMAAPTAAAGSLLIFMSAYNELTVSALLWSTGHETIGVMIFNLYDEGEATAASAASVLSVLATLAAAGAASLLARRLPKGVLPWQA